MKTRIAGKVVCACLCLVFALLALIYVRLDGEHVVRSITLSVLSLTAAVSYRHFEY